MSFFKKILRATTKYFKKKASIFCTAVIVAAGTASRMQGTDKIMTLLDGEPVISRTVRSFQECAAIKQIVIVTRADLVAEIRTLCQENGFSKVIAVVTGGENRQESVALGLAHVPEATTHAAVHDGARPLVSGTVIEAAVNKAVQTGAAAPAVPVKDTVKVAKGGLVMETPDRSALFAVQTPQVFDVDLLRGAINNARENGLVLTDDCSAVEKLGMRVHLVQGSEENIKITTPLDLWVAEGILKRRRDLL